MIETEPIPCPMSPKPKRLQKPTKVYEEYKKCNEQSKRIKK